MKCSAYENGSRFDTYLAVLLALGIVFSYVPQQVAIVRRRTIEGISPIFLLLMNIGANMGFGNMLLESAPIISCCSQIKPWQCVNSLLGLVQMTAASIGPLLILLLSVKYTGYDYTEYSEMRRIFKTVLCVLAIMMFTIAMAWNTPRSRDLANFFGLVATIVGLIQYFPQLMTTYRLKHTGSLSKMTLLIQIPGGYLWCFSLYMRENSVWSTWLSIFVAASLQLLLLILAVYYSFVNTQHVVEVISKPATPRADSPLLRSNSRSES